MTKNYEAWRITPLMPAQYAALDLYDKLLFLCKLGHLAPNSHNSQPWRFFIDTDPKNPKIDMYLDRCFVLPASDIVGRQAAISMGCAIENMAVGASFLHANPRIEIITQKKDALASCGNKKDSFRYVHLARFHYATASHTLPCGDLYKSIFSRKVMRAEFDPQKSLDADVIKQLMLITNGKETKLHVITDAMRKFGIAEFQGQADGFVINSPRFSKELGAWLLPNNTDSPLGMPGIGFGLRDDQALRIHDALIGKTSLQPEDTLKFALAGKIGMEKSPFIGCITIPKDGITYWIEAGRSFERIFLTLESKGISVAVHAGIIEVALINRIFAASLGTLRKPAVLFRAGIVKYEKDKIRPHSPRLPIKDVVLSSKPTDK